MLGGQPLPRRLRAKGRAGKEGLGVASRLDVPGGGSESYPSSTKTGAGKKAAALAAGLLVWCDSNSHRPLPGEEKGRARKAPEKGRWEICLQNQNKARRDLGGVLIQPHICILGLGLECYCNKNLLKDYLKPFFNIPSVVQNMP